MIIRHIMYSILESLKYISQTFETAKRYSKGAAFITMEFYNIFNTQGIRYSIETVSNEDFPAIFRGNNNK